MFAAGLEKIGVEGHQLKEGVLGGGVLAWMAITVIRSYLPTQDILRGS